MSRKKIGQCYLCGAIGKMTDEHVPPKFLSPTLPDSDFVKVSVCSSCNNSNSHEESKFRDFVVSASYAPENPSTKGAFEAMMRNFTRNSFAEQLLGKPNKDLLRVWTGMKKRKIYTPGGVYLGEAITISPAKDLQWKKILIKIAKGLHFLFSGQVIPSDYESIAFFINRIDNPEVFNSLSKKGRAGHFFAFRGDWTKEDAKAGVWYITFYKKVSAVVWFFPPSFAEKRKKIANEKGIS